ncbi:hypothetical protein ABW21_db0200206 [Orbilia brochopaga]|nr:hypothetical protein ABW21_db0200206 [Drechslerella brochopaga]
MVYTDTVEAIKHSDESLELAFYETDAKGLVNIMHESELTDLYPKLGKGETVHRVGVILHRKAECTQNGLRGRPSFRRQSAARATIGAHVAAGCGQLFDRTIVPFSIGFYPLDIKSNSVPASINTSPIYTGNGTGGSTPSASIKKRKAQTSEIPQAITGPSSAVIGKTDTSTFEPQVKSTYKVCALSGEESQFGDLNCGPGLDVAHIVPKDFWFAYPLSPAASGDAGPMPSDVPPLYRYTMETMRCQYSRTWDSANGLLLRADLHAVFDKRLIGIHPVDLKIRVFAPMKAYIGLHGKQAYIPKDADIDRKALRWHWMQCIIENFSAHSFHEQQEARQRCYSNLVDKVEALSTNALRTGPWGGFPNSIAHVDIAVTVNQPEEEHGQGVDMNAVSERLRILVGRPPR